MNIDETFTIDDWQQEDGSDIAKVTSNDKNYKGMRDKKYSTDGIESDDQYDSDEDLYSDQEIGEINDEDYMSARWWVAPVYGGDVESEKDSGEYSEGDYTYDDDMLGYYYDSDGNAVNEKTGEIRDPYPASYYGEVDPNPEDYSDEGEDSGEGEDDEGEYSSEGEDYEGDDDEGEYSSEGEDYEGDDENFHIDDKTGDMNEEEISEKNREIENGDIDEAFTDKVMHMDDKDNIIGKHCNTN